MEGCACKHLQSLHEIDTSRPCPSIGVAQFLPGEGYSGASDGCAVVRQGETNVTQVKAASYLLKCKLLQVFFPKNRAELSLLMLRCDLSHALITQPCSGESTSPRNGNFEQPDSSVRDVAPVVFSRAKLSDQPLCVLILRSQLCNFFVKFHELPSDPVVGDDAYEQRALDVDPVEHLVSRFLMGAGRLASDGPGYDSEYRSVFFGRETFHKPNPSMQHGKYLRGLSAVLT